MQTQDTKAAFDAMREALAALCERSREIMQYTNKYDGQLIQAIANGEAALGLANWISER